MVFLHKSKLCLSCFSCLFCAQKVYKLYQAGKGVKNALRISRKQGKQSEITLSWLPLGSALLAQRFLVKNVFYLDIYLDKRSNLKDNHLTFYFSSIKLNF